MILVKNGVGAYRNIAHMDALEDSMVGGSHVFCRRYHPNAIESVVLHDMTVSRLLARLRGIHRGESEPVIHCEWDESWTEIGRPVSREFSRVPDPAA